MTNEERYMELLRVVDPELYLIKQALVETGVNAMILPRIVRSLGNLSIGTGFGVIEILVKSRTVTQIKSNESDVLNLSVDTNL